MQYHARCREWHTDKTDSGHQYSAHHVATELRRRQVPLREPLRSAPPEPNDIFLSERIPVTVCQLADRIELIVKYCHSWFVRSSERRQSIGT